MSDKTREALEDAMKAHFTDETGGGYLLDWIWFSAGPAHDSDLIDYVFGESESAFHSLTGLARMGLRHLEGHQEVDDE